MSTPPSGDAREERDPQGWGVEEALEEIVDSALGTAHLTKGWVNPRPCVEQILAALDARSAPAATPPRLNTYLRRGHDNQCELCGVPDHRHVCPSQAGFPPSPPAEAPAATPPRKTTAAEAKRFVKRWCGGAITEPTDGTAPHGTLTTLHGVEDALRT